MKTDSATSTWYPLGIWKRSLPELKQRRKEGFVSLSKLDSCFRAVVRQTRRDHRAWNGHVTIEAGSDEESGIRNI